MPDFDERESSQFLGAPVFLYLFRYGEESDAFHAFTDAEQAIVYSGVTYVPVPISHSNVESSGKMDSKDFEITVSRDNAIAYLLSFYPSSFVITLVIRQGHIAQSANPFDPALDPEVLPVVWTGRIVERSSQDRVRVKLVGMPAGASMKRPGLTRHWQYSCPLALYGDRCGADKVAATTTGTVVSVTGNRITLEDEWMIVGTGLTDYLGGIIQWQGDFGPEYRMILGTEDLGATVLTTGPTGELSEGSEISISLGCPRTLEACGRLHDNVVNYGGHPFIPKFNPVNKNPFD